MTISNVRKLSLTFLAAFGFSLAVEGIAMAKGAREKFITREAKSKGKAGDSTKVNFDEVDIGGQRKTPMGTLVNNNKMKKDYDFIKLRQRWHPEMIESASSLESGGN
jgi:hypothetical protein